MSAIELKVPMPVFAKGLATCLRQTLAAHFAERYPLCSVSRMRIAFPQ